MTEKYRNVKRFILTSLLAIAACQTIPSPSPTSNSTPQPVSGNSQVSTLEKSKDCVGHVSKFGTYGGQYYPPSATISSNNDGAWCWVDITFSINNGSVITAETSVLTVANHGEVLIGQAGSKSRFAYKPKPGFSGSDTFTARAVTPMGTYDIPFAVTVAP